MKTRIYISYFFSSMALLLFMCSAAMAQGQYSQVTLKASNGQYMCAEGGGGGAVVANRNAVGPWEIFTLSEVSDMKYALQANNGKHLCAEGGGGGIVVANRDEIRIWETFTLIKLPTGKYALQANNGQYVCAEGGGGGAVVANRNAIGPWETFTLELLPNGPGRNIREVSFGLNGQTHGDMLGSFTQAPNRIWHERGADNAIRFTFVETNRDLSSVYLHDSSRGVSLQLNFNLAEIMYSDADAPRPRSLYRIMISRYGGQ